MGYNLLINGVYWGYNPANQSHLLTSWDIQVVFQIPPVWCFSYVFGVQITFQIPNFQFSSHFEETYLANGPWNKSLNSLNGLFSLLNLYSPKVEKASHWPSKNKQRDHPIAPEATRKSHRSLSKSFTPSPHDETRTDDPSILMTIQGGPSPPIVINGCFQK